MLYPDFSQVRNPGKASPYHTYARFVLDSIRGIRLSASLTRASEIKDSINQR